MDRGLLVFDVDRMGRDAIDNHSIGWHDDRCTVSKAFGPTFVLFELYRFGGCASEYLYVSTFELVYSDYFDRFGGHVVIYRGLYVLSSLCRRVRSVSLGDTIVL